MIKKFGFHKSRECILPEQQLLEAIAKQLKFERPDEVRSVLNEARRGNKVAQYIVGIALQGTRQFAAADGWLELSADQGYEPAKLHLRSQLTRIVFRT